MAARLFVSRVRLGHANNSSSTHSILVGCSAREDYLCGEFEFGWEDFHLRDADSKAKYMAMMFVEGMEYAGVSRDVAVRVVKEVTSLDVPKDGYVDHQSVLTMPVHPDRSPHHEFLAAVFDKIVNDLDVSVAGGNDNSDDQEWTRGVKRFTGLDALPRESSDRLRCRESGGRWTLYNVETGSKIRFSLDESPDPGEDPVPALVDLKITQWCGETCNFCYQGSTTRGKHAEFERVRDLLSAMGKSGVFEVALGGGEPTAHPNFVEILRAACDAEITPNFTTFRATNVIRDAAVGDAVAKYCGSFAFSSLDSEEIAWASAWNKEHVHPTATLQVPMGCYPRDLVATMIGKACDSDVPVTLLGYKPVGRAKGHPPVDYSWIVDWLTAGKIADRIRGDAAGIEFGADTVFVDQMRGKLDAAGVAECLLAGREGALSCYVDAVSGTMGPCSFRPEAMHAIPGDLGKMWERFPYKG